VTTYVALLRGINVGGHRPVAMPALRGIFEGLGYTKVATYIQSGNVVFDAPGGAARAIADEVESAILGELGFGVDVVVRSAAEMAAVVAGNPFVPRVTDTKALHVAFARDPIKGAPAVDRDIAPGEASIGSGVIYLHAPGGFGRSKLTDAFLKRLAGSPVTTRNWNTVTKLAELSAR
jgi:uncharacterized protein (DUF1697 family)